MHVHAASRRTLLAVLALAAVGIAGCGTSDATKPSEPATGGGSRERAADSGALVLQADKNRLAYDKNTLSARPGKVTIVMVNPSEVPHDVAIEGNDVTAKSKVVSKGGKSSVTADLKPGTYTFYCTVGAHKQAGMTGALTVR